MTGHVNLNGTWKNLAGMSVNIDGTWKNVSAAYANVNGVWKIGYVPPRTIVALAGLNTSLNAPTSFYVSTNSGLSYSSVPLPSTTPPHKIAYGNGIFVASTASGNYDYYKSIDGLSWTAATTAGSLVQNSLLFANNKFFIINNDSDQIQYSSDGTSWTVSYTGPSRGTYSYANNMFFGLASDYRSQYSYSIDGISWTNSSFASSANRFVGGVVYGNSTYLAYPGNNTSADGINWTARTSPATFSNVVFGLGIFYAIQNNNSNVGYYSTDGISWTSQSLPNTGHVTNDIIFNGEQFLITTSDPNAFQGYIYSSVDPINIGWGFHWQNGKEFYEISST